MHYAFAELASTCLRRVWMINYFFIFVWGGSLDTVVDDWFWSPILVVWEYIIGSKGWRVTHLSLARWETSKIMSVPRVASSRLQPELKSSGWRLQRFNNDPMSLVRDGDGIFVKIKEKRWFCLKCVRYLFLPPICKKANQTITTSN